MLFWTAIIALATISGIIVTIFLVVKKKTDKGKKELNNKVNGIDKELVKVKTQYQLLDERFDKFEKGIHHKIDHQFDEIKKDIYNKIDEKFKIIIDLFKAK